MYKWKPSKAQKKAFAKKMQDPTEAAAYAERREQRAAERRRDSQFDYETAGGRYVPTKSQYDFALQNMTKFCTDDEKLAANAVIGAYACNDRVHHDLIHIVNEKMRNT